MPATVPSTMSTIDHDPSTAVFAKDMETGNLGTPELIQDDQVAASQSDSSEGHANKEAVVSWEEDKRNPTNWPRWRKLHLVIMLSSFAFLAYVFDYTKSRLQNQNSYH